MDNMNFHESDVVVPTKKQRIEDSDKTPKIDVILKDAKEENNSEIEIKIASKYYVSSVNPIATVALKILRKQEVIKDYCKTCLRVEGKSVRCVKELFKAMKYCHKKGFRHLIISTDLQPIMCVKDMSYANNKALIKLKWKCLMFFNKFESYRIRFDISPDMRELNKRATRALDNELEDREPFFHSKI